MDRLIIGIVVIWGALWLLGVALRVLSDITSAVSQHWERTRPGRERVGYAIGHPMGVMAATIEDHRLMSMGLAITLCVAAMVLAGADSASLVSYMDGFGGKDFPLLGWAFFGGIAGITMGVGSRVIELGWFRAAAISRVPDIGHLRAGEEAAARYFRIRSFAAVVGAAILLSALVFSYFRNSGYDPRADIDTKSAAIAAAGADGKIAVLNGALEDSAGLLQSDPKSGLKILATLNGLSREAGRPEVERVAKIAQKYLSVYREETEKLVTDGKPEALARSEAFSEVDRVASLAWLGRLHEGGKGGAKRDLSKAFSYYSEAASAGDKTAATMQDKLVHTMVSAKDDGDRQAAFKYLEPRAQAGWPYDHYWLGEWYARSSKQEDQKNAEKWLVKALTQDADVGIKSLAFLSLAKIKDVSPAAVRVLDDQAPKYAKGKDENMKKAAYTYLEQRARAGDPGAALWMGFRHAEGDGVPKDAQKAHDWFLKAARQDKNIAVKNKAFEALGERNHPPIPGSENVPVSEVRGTSPSNDVVYEKSEVEPRTYQEPVRPTEPIPSPATRDKTSSIPANASLNVYGNGWVCNRGYRQSGNECASVQVPQNAGLDVYGHGWTCNRGYRQSGNGCVLVLIPANAELDVYGHGWTCSRGYRQSDNDCVSVQIPQNAELDVYGHGWTCSRGYRQSGNRCVLVQIPQNAGLDVYGHGWTCNRGYRQAGNECLLVLVPANAVLNVYGNGWACNNGYRQVGMECVPK
jgi:TPR repeat protein